MLLHAFGGRRIRFCKVNDLAEEFLMELPDTRPGGPVAVRVLVVTPIDGGCHQIAIQIGASNEWPPLCIRDLVECCPHLSACEDVDTIANGSSVDFKFGWIIIRRLGDRDALAAHVELVSEAVAHRQRVRAAQGTDLPVLNEWKQPTLGIAGFDVGVDVVDPQIGTHPGKRFVVVLPGLAAPGVACAAHPKDVALIRTIDEYLCRDLDGIAFLRLGDGAAGLIERGVVEGDGPDGLALFVLLERLVHGDRPLARRRVDGGVPDLDVAQAVLVDHGDAPVLNRLLESLAILFVAAAPDGMPAMLLFLHLHPLHQELVGRAAHGVAFAPVQIVDASAGHAAEPTAGLDEDDLGPLFLRSQRRHDAACRAAVHTDVDLVMRDLCCQAVLAGQQGDEDE